MRGSRVVFVVLAMVVSASACAGAGAKSDAADADASPASAVDPASSPTSPTISPELVATAPAALQFSAPTVGGGSIDFTQFAGQTVALWFWAPT